MEQPTRYRRPSESAYTKGAWWAGHGAELIGATAGFAIGFVILLLVQAAAPGAEVGWIPLATLVIGAFGLRTLVRRQLRR
jgi:preprotein translocase subunit Sss1